MRTIFILVSFLFTAAAMACVNSMPMSTALFAIANNGAGENAEMSCKNRPEEVCVCFDGITEWAATDFVDWLEDDHAKPITVPADCDGCEPKVIGYEKKIVGKKLVDSPEKISALKEAKRLEELKRKEIRDRLKNPFQLKGTTISALKAELQQHLEDLREAQK